VVNTRKPTIVDAPELGARLIATERDAAEAWGAGSDMHLWAREWLARPPGAPLVLTPAAGLAAWPELGPQPIPLALLALQGDGIPALGIELAPDGVWHRVQLEHDRHREPPLRCTVDGEETPLEQVRPGVWRPVSPAPTKASG
jgi:hypothetical protein